MATAYPARGWERDRWIVSLRPPRVTHDPGQPQDCLVEDERAESGRVVSVATVFLTGRECPWRCLMCDLWKHTLVGTTPPGAIPAQIGRALTKLPPARQLKLYNSSSFFDAAKKNPANFAAGNPATLAARGGSVVLSKE